MADNGEIVLDRGPIRSKLTFAGPNDVQAFLDREQQLWSWTTQTDFTTNNGNVNAWASRYRPDWVNSILGHVKQWKEAPDEQSKATARNEITGVLRQRFVNEKFLAACDPEAGAISELAKSDRDSGAVALTFFHGAAPFT